MEELKECLENEIDITWFNKYLNNALRKNTFFTRIMNITHILMEELIKNIIKLIRLIAIIIL